ncbi:GNAT family N-acetyltransferase, partial [Candidatus Bathyarchaeota archaeon]|nr:GNAT family N-acetyltransferase [Candidatus Bathyarchaeota archaeon]
MVSEIIFGVPKNQRVRVAEIIYDAFENEFENVFGSDKGISLISKHLRNDRTVIAVSKGAVIGVGGLKFEGKEFIDVNFWQLLRELKFGIFRVLFFGWKFYHKVEEKELLIDVLAVVRDMRGKGIGSKLVAFIIDFACLRGYKQVKLFVNNTNEKAKILYERMGFREVKAHKI